MAGIGDIAKKGGVKYEDAQKTIDGIRQLILEGEKITLQDFGTFSVDVQDERDGINPTTKESIVTPAKSVPKFKFNYTFRAKVAENVKVDKEKLKKKQDYKAKYNEKYGKEIEKAEKPVDKKADKKADKKK